MDGVKKRGSCYCHPNSKSCYTFFCASISVDREQRLGST